MIPCPTPSQLNDMLAERLPRDEQQAIEEHLEGCRRCQQALEEAVATPANLDRSDGFQASGSTYSQDVEALLAELRTSGGAPSLEAEAPDQIEGYRLIRELGRGGMGIVFEAEQDYPVRRRVALKILIPGTDSRQVVARFKAEQQALARMEHVSIPCVLDAGTIPSGRPYFVTELVGGSPITEYCDRNRLSVGERLRLFASVCHALEHAHRKGVVHRDIKPSNVLIAECDGGPVPKVIDFGLAKALEQPLTEHTSFTRHGQVLGTPEYMSPEQAALTREDIDARSDVYSLGVLLYELLTGTTPLERRGTDEIPLDELLRTIRQVDPRKPSSRLSACDSERHTASRRIQMLRKTWIARVRGDLDAIVMKALDKDRDRRYGTAAEFATDVQRHLNNEPIDARPITGWQRLVRWSRRKPALAALMGVVLMLGAIGFPGVTVLWLDAAQARDRALRSEKAERWASYRANIAAAGGYLELNNGAAARRALEAAPPVHRDWEWRHYRRRLFSRRLVLEGHRSAVWSVAFSPDGRRVASFSDDGHARLWDAESGQIVQVLPGNRGAYRWSGVAFSPDSRLLAAPGADGSICLLAAEDGQRQALLHGRQGHPVQALFSPDGAHLLSRGEDDTTVKLWDVRLRSEIGIWDLQAPVTWIGFSPDGDFYAAGTERGVVSVWYLETHELAARWTGHEAPIAAADFSPDGRRLVTSSMDFVDCRLRMWRLPDGKPIATMPGHANAVSAVRFSPDGGTLASGSTDQTVRLWDGRSGDVRATLSGHLGAVYDIAFSPDGGRLASASNDSTARIWDAVDGSLQSVLYGHSREVSALRFDRSGRTLATASNDRTVSLWDVGHATRPRLFRGHTGYVYEVAFSPDGEHVASAAWDGTFRLWSVASGEELLRLDADGPKIATGVAFDPNGDRLATLERGAMRLWDLTSGECLCRVRMPEVFHSDARIAFSPSGELIAAGTSDGQIWWWDGSAKRVAVTNAHSEHCRDVAFSPDSLRLASAGHDGFAHVWDVPSKKRIATLHGHGRAVTSVEFNAAGTLLATGSEDGTARLWDAHDFSERAVLDHQRHVYDVSFHPDGTRLATACVDNSVRLWDVATGDQVAELRGHKAYAYALDFSPDGAQLVSGSGDCTIRVWDTLPATERTGHDRQRK